MRLNIKVQINNSNYIELTIVKLDSVDYNPSLKYCPCGTLYHIPLISNSTFLQFEIKVQSNNRDYYQKILRANIDSDIVTNLSNTLSSDLSSNKFAIEHSLALLLNTLTVKHGIHFNNTRGCKDIS